MSILGIDTKLDPNVRDYTIIAGRMAEIPADKEKPHEIVLDQGFAEAPHPIGPRFHHGVALGLILGLISAVIAQQILSHFMLPVCR